MLPLFTHSSCLQLTQYSQENSPSTMNSHKSSNFKSSDNHLQLCLCLQTCPTYYSLEELKYLILGHIENCVHCCKMNRIKKRCQKKTVIPLDPPTACEKISLDRETNVQLNGELNRESITVKRLSKEKNIYPPEKVCHDFKEESEKYCRTSSDKQIQSYHAYTTNSDSCESKETDTVQTTNNEELPMYLPSKKVYCSPTYQVYPEAGYNLCQTEVKNKETEALTKELEITRQRLYNSERKLEDLKRLYRKDIKHVWNLKGAIKTENPSSESTDNSIRLSSSSSYSQLLCAIGNKKFSKLLNEDIDELYATKKELENTCAGLKMQRETIVSEMMQTLSQFHPESTSVSQIQASINWNTVDQFYSCHLKSVNFDIANAQEAYQRLVCARDDIVKEIILINNKNTELTMLNNDLSKRIARREIEARIFIESTSFLNLRDESHSTKKEFQNGFHSHGGTPGDRYSDPTLSTLPDISRVPKLKRTKDAVFSIFGGSDSYNRNGTKTSIDEIRPPSSECTKKAHSYNGRQKGAVPLSSSERNKLIDLGIQEHNFHAMKFIRPSKCEACGEKVWGANELKCQETDCGVVCHSRCATHVTSLCKRKKGNIYTFFHQESSNRKSRDISSSTNTNKSHKERGSIDIIVLKCVEAIEERGMRMEGIYRKQGGSTQIRQVQSMFDRGEIPDLKNEEDYEDICTVTSVLKQYFINLQQPLFTKELHSQFLKAMEIQPHEEKLEQLRHLFKVLPRANYDTIHYLILHLNRVSQESPYNLMTSYNLAVIFGPTLMQNKAGEQSIEETKVQIQVIQLLIEHVHLLFEVSLHSAL
ncbi:hypothetical protein BDF14DRAFT_1773804 [Spinellus fusiger]|nr:hypothetical protein BDF14DRAFT_1773804 [Spinellus fusiger]